MAVRKFRPTTLSRRGVIMATFEEITTNTPGKSLPVSLNKNGGRNVQGKIAVRHHGGRAKKEYRIIDLKRNKDGIPAKIATIEYDPNRIAHIALVVYADGGKKYIITPVGSKVGSVIVSGPDADIETGNTLPLKDIPVDAFVYNVKLQVGKGAQMIRSAGTATRLVAKGGDYATLKLPSGEIRHVRTECRATIGTVSNTINGIVNIGKTGRKRHMGWRPTVRGPVMSPNDHPHDGSEDRSPIDGPSPVIPWGEPALGYKTRKSKKYSDRFIIERRSDK